MKVHRRGYSTFSSSSMGSSRSTRTRLGLHPTGGPGGGHISWGSCTGRRRRSRAARGQTNTLSREEIISPLQKTAEKIGEQFNVSDRTVKNAREWSGPEWVTARISRSRWEADLACQEKNPSGPRMA